MHLSSGAKNAGETPHERALSSTVAAKYGDPFARADAEGDVGKHVASRFEGEREPDGFNGGDYTESPLIDCAA